MQPNVQENNAKKSSSPSQLRTCLICYQKVSSSAQNYFKLKECQHKFHKECLINYIQRIESDQKFNCCPSCKKPYNSEKVLKQNNLIESNIQCVICYSQYTEQKIPCSLPCNHYFHQNCLIQWNENCKSDSSPCPYCRKMYSQKDIQLRWDVFAKIQKLKGIENQSQNQEEDNEDSQDISISTLGIESSMSVAELGTNQSDITSLEDQIAGSILQELSSSRIEEKSLSELSSKSQSSNNNQIYQQQPVQRIIQTDQRASSKQQLEVIIEEEMQLPTTNLKQQEQPVKQSQKQLDQNSQKVDEKSEDKDSLTKKNSSKTKNQTEFQIFVQDLNGKTVVVNVSQNLNVKQFAKMISEKSNIESDQLRFTCQGKSFSVQNNAEEILGNLKVEKNSTVHVLLKLKGGHKYFEHLFF